MIVFGDIAGHFDSLMKLVGQVPKGPPLVFVGDLCDRGTQSKEVIEWVKSNAAESLMGNHEDMLLDFFSKGHRYDEGIWHYNGGFATLQSYFPDITYEESFDLPNIPNTYPDVLKEHIEWLSKRPITYETDTVFVSHAPYEETVNHFDVLWNRRSPDKTNKFQIYGHNGIFKKHEDYAICIDNSRNGFLTAIDTDTRIIYREAYR